MTSKLDNELLKFSNVEHLDNGKFLVRKGFLDKKEIQFEKGRYYIIGISSTAVSRDIIESTRINWNSGKYLGSSFLKCEPISIQGNMIQLNACGYDPVKDEDLSDIYLNFWVHKNTIYILDEIS